MYTIVKRFERTLSDSNIKFISLLGKMIMLTIKIKNIFSFFLIAYHNYDMTKEFTKLFLLINRNYGKVKKYYLIMSKYLSL